MKLTTPVMPGCVLFLTLLIAGCASTQPRPSLYDEFGQRAGLGSLVDGLIKRIHANEKIAPLFSNTDFALFRQRFLEFLCVTVDGPCTYTGEELEEVHTGMNITEAEFNTLVEDLIDVMQELAIAQAAQNEMLKRLAPTRKDVIYR